MDSIRRKDREVTELARMVQILDACTIAHVAMVDAEGMPYVVPVNYGYSLADASVTMYFHGANQGKKAGILQEGCPVALCVDREIRTVAGDTACAFGVAYQSVMLFGNVHLINDEKEKQKALTAMMRKVTERSLPFDKAAIERTAVYAVRVHRWTAKECDPK